MSDMTFEQMLEASFKTIHTGEVVEGTVIDVKPTEAILNVGYKSDGVLTKNEYTNDPSVDLTEAIKVGDTMEVKVIKVNDGEGQVLLTYKRLAADRGSKRLEEAFEKQEILTAKVSQVLDGGVCVVVEEVRVFIPASLVSDTFEKDLSKYAGQEIEFVVTEYNPKKRRFIGNRKVILVARKEEAQKKLLATIKEGDVVEGVIKNVTDFGVFVDLGGMDGLLHISEMSWGHVENPKKNYKAGDKLTVLIKEINENKIALSLKFNDTNPWVNAEEKYAVGTEVTGKVMRMTDFGAFVELESGIDALLHVSQISKDHIEKPSDVLKVGDEVTAKVVDFNIEEKRVSISVKAMYAPEPKEEKAEDDDADVASVDIEAVIAAEEATEE
ncbi:MAG: 30S ribosomal protein S1 [Lachnospiraceae bacterium]|nr:30S ribosomal protein S1 [Lachnospiraceae bacterium]